MAETTMSPSLQQACREIDQLKERVAELDRKLLLLSPSNNISTANDAPPSAIDALTASLPKSRSTPALDRLNAQLRDSEQIAMSGTRIVMHQIVLPSDTDSLGICFGGQVLGWIDVCAGLAAKTVARGPVVTASVDAVHFLKPCRVV